MQNKQQNAKTAESRQNRQTKMRERSGCILFCSVLLSIPQWQVSGRHKECPQAIVCVSMSEDLWAWLHACLGACVGNHSACCGSFLSGTERPQNPCHLRPVTIEPVGRIFEISDSNPIRGKRGKCGRSLSQAPPSYGSGRYGFGGLIGAQDSVLRDRCSVGTRHAFSCSPL